MDLVAELFARMTQLVSALPYDARKWSVDYQLAGLERCATQGRCDAKHGDIFDYRLQSWSDATAQLDRSSATTMQNLGFQKRAMLDYVAMAGQYLRALDASLQP